MPFVEIEKLRPSFHGFPRQPIVTMGAYLADGKKHTSKSIMFRISDAVLVQLGWQFNAEDAIYVRIHEGNGNDAGFLQIVTVEQSVSARKITRPKSVEKKQGISVNISVSSLRHYVLNECPVTAAEVVHTIDGDALIIQCPDWLRYNPLSYEEPEVKKPTVTARPPTVSVEVDDEAPLNRRDRRYIGKKIANELRR